MKAAYIQKYGQEKVILGNLAKPTIINPNQVLVKVISTSINPVDLKIQQGKLKPLLHFDFPLILGNDYVGIVEQVGSQVKSVKVGQRVSGRISKKQIGTFCEYLVDDVENMAIVPDVISNEQAAALPLVGLTAYQALFEKMQVKADESILIHAGAGGLGSTMIQLAKNSGLKVITTASAKNHPFLYELGADLVIDYRTQDFTQICPPVDYVFDTIGSKTLLDSFKVVKPQGKVVSVSGLPDKKFAQSYGLNLFWQQAFGLVSSKITHAAKKARAEYEFLFMQPNGQQLATLFEQLANHQLAIQIDRQYDFEQIQEALDYVAKGHAKGKVIVKI